jgi:hypothetical protein
MRLKMSKQLRTDNLFTFRHADAKPSRKDTASQDEIEKALATVLRAIERLAAKLDALTGKGA